jgi:hypothetical protein
MIRAEAFRVVLCSCAALFLSANVMAQSAAVGVATGDAPGMRTKAADLEVRAKVVELDQKQRVATLRRASGELVTVDVPAEMKNFDAVRVGDDVVLRYSMASVIALEPTSSKSGIRERVVSSSVATAASGAMPSVAGRRTVEVLAVITALDRKARTATLRGPSRSITVDVPADMDVSTVIESAVLSVQHTPATKK